jgi:hypothetical protein
MGTAMLTAMETGMVMGMVEAMAMVTEMAHLCPTVMLSAMVSAKLVTRFRSLGTWWTLRAITKIALVKRFQTVRIPRRAHKTTWSGVCPFLFVRRIIWLGTLGRPMHQITKLHGSWTMREMHGS